MKREVSVRGDGLARGGRRDAGRAAVSGRGRQGDERGAVVRAERDVDEAPVVVARERRERGRVERRRRARGGRLGLVRAGGVDAVVARECDADGAASARVPRPAVHGRGRPTGAGAEPAAICADAG